MTATDILGGLLRVNLAAGAAILVVVALRKMIRSRFGARLAYGLWLLPVLASAAVMAPARQVLIVQSAAPAFAAAPPVHQAFLASAPDVAMSLDPFVLLVGLWLLGVAVTALIMARLQHRFISQARGGAVGPAVVGVISPRIVTPQDFAERYSPGEQALVLAHERAHIARQDSRLNGLCAAAQCLCWFNPLVHLAARLMRIDQELACDETVVTRFPGARRAYAEVLLKAQLAILPLPLGCYWTSATEHPLVERVAMLKQKHTSPARRLAGAAALAVLCAGGGLTAWAAQPAEVRIEISPPGYARLAHPAPISLMAPMPVKAAITVARNEASSAPLLAVAEIDAASDLSAQDMAAPRADTAPAGPAAGESGHLRLAELQVRPPDDQDGSPALEQAARLQAPPTSQVTAPSKVTISLETTDADASDQVICKAQLVTGSRFEKRVCMTQIQWDELHRRYAA
ncbi:MAG TPA: M56 family metallopeptidase, partial [Caulobacteraceae bacterium]